MASTTRSAAATKRFPAGAWHVDETRWGESQRVRLITGAPSLVSDPIQIRSIHVVGFVGGPVGAPADDHVLLVQNKDHSWTFPGGRLEGCETLREALDREVWEEARASIAPDFTPIAATRIEFLNRVPGRVYRVHPTFLLWVTGTVSCLSDEPHNDPADSVIGRRVVATGDARTLLAPLEIGVLDAALERRGNVSKRLVVAITGASGAIYGVRFLRQAVTQFDEVYVILSSNARSVLATEMDINVSESPTARELLGVDAPQLRFCSTRDYFTPPASGSFRHDGMVIIPCSMGTAGRIASGVSDDLTTRAADVCLKEKRPLVLVVRETPLNLIHLRNLTTLAEAGATVLPAAPAFYHRPQTIEALVDTVVARALQAVGATQDLMREWKHEE